MDGFTLGGGKKPMRHRRAVVILVAVFLFLPATAAQADQVFGPAVSPLGPEENVHPYDWTPSGGTVSCNNQDYQEQPVRAYRFTDEDGVERVALPYGTNIWGRRLVGDTLDTVVSEHLLPAPRTRSCGVLGRTYTRHNSTNPSLYEHWEFLSSAYIEDGIAFPTSPTKGRRAYGFLHEEFHPTNTTPGQPDTCTAPPTGITLSCWMAATTTVTSTDGGRCFDQTGMNGNGCVWGDASTPRPDVSLVASIPYKFEDNWGHRGANAPSNVIYDAAHGYFYAFVHLNIRDTDVTCSAQPFPACYDPNAENQPAYRDQQRGMCLIRTQNLSQPSSWRGWDGTGSTAWDIAGFSVRFINPYTESAPPAPHRCQPVAFDVLSSGGVGSLSFNTYFNKYMYVGRLYEGAQEESDWDQVIERDGIYYWLSPDLIHWNQPQRIFTAQASFNGSDNPPCHGYPSVLDPTDPAASQTAAARNFDHPARTPYVYFRDWGCADGFRNAIARRHIQFNHSPTDPATEPVTRKEFTQGARINFQPFGSKLPETSPYTTNGFGEDSSVSTHVNRIDPGNAFEGVRGFGWVRDDSLSSSAHVPLNLTANTRDRHGLTNQENDTLIYMNPPNGTSAECAGLTRTKGAFEMNVPNGNYLVLASVGDGSYVGPSADPCNNSVHHVSAEGVSLLNPFTPSMTQPFANGYAMVTVTDGRLTIREDQGTNTKLDWVDIRKIG
jgi:hypothetical protein